MHTPEQVRQVLDAARRADLDVCRHLALRYFAGLRSAEVHRIREEDLKLDQALIEVPAVKSKTRARRLVTVQPNLAAWPLCGHSTLESRITWRETSLSFRGRQRG